MTHTEAVPVGEQTTVPFIPALLLNEVAKFKPIRHRLFSGRLLQVATFAQSLPDTPNTP